jgi:ADP-L-glycero-D-manno-heptose 6-epimerase
VGAIRALVTGGTGFIGSAITERLLRDGHEVWITGRSGEQQPHGLEGRILPTFTSLEWARLGTVDALFHHAAISADDPRFSRDEVLRVNLEASKALFQEAVMHGCRRIIYASSTAAYGDAPAPFREDGPLRPISPYGESKKLLDEWAMPFARRHPGLTVVGFRYCNVYGPGEGHKGRWASMPYQLAQQMLAGNPKLFRWGEQKRDHIYIKDVVAANMAALQAAESCVLNCGSGKATSFNALVGILNEALGTDRKPEYIENPRPGSYQSHTECDMTLAREKLGFTPQYDLRAGIRDYTESGALVPR